MRSIISDDIQVLIRRSWNNWKIGSCKLADLSGFRWDNMAGGVRAHAPFYSIYAYVSCEDIDGELDHSCLHGHGPHSIKVCVIKKDNKPCVMKHLAALVGPKPVLYNRRLSRS